MRRNFQQLDLQTLIDLLAEETRKYTKAFVSGTQDEVLRYKATTDNLVAEINRRKKEGSSLSPTVGTEIPPHDYSEVTL